MPRQIIATTAAPGSPLFSQAVRAGQLLLLSGTAGIDPTSGRLSGDTIQTQTRQALTNYQAILAAAGADLDDVVEVGILLSNPEDFAGLNEEWARWFACAPPAPANSLGAPPRSSCASAGRSAPRALQTPSLSLWCSWWGWGRAGQE